MGQQQSLTCRGCLRTQGVPKGTALEPRTWKRGAKCQLLVSCRSRSLRTRFQGAGRGSAILRASILCHHRAELPALHRLYRQCRHLPEIRLPRMSKPTIFNNSVEVCSLHQKLHPFLVQWHIFAAVFCACCHHHKSICKHFYLFTCILRYIHKIPSACSQ